MSERTHQRIFPNCWRCEQPFDVPDCQRQYLYCPACREVLGTERIREEVERLDWPEFVECQRRARGEVMPTAKEISEFLELDKDNIELVEIIGSCHFDAGVSSGRLKGALNAWVEITNEVQRLYDKSAAIDKTALLVLVHKKLMEAHDKYENPPKPRPDRLEKAAWKVLKKRIAK